MTPFYMTWYEKEYPWNEIQEPTVYQCSFCDRKIGIKKKTRFRGCLTCPFCLKSGKSKTHFMEL